MSTCNCEKQDGYANCCRTKAFEKAIQKFLGVEKPISAWDAGLLLTQFAILVKKITEELTQLRAKCENYEAALKEIAGCGPCSDCDADLTARAVLSEGKEK